MKINVPDRSMLVTHEGAPSPRVTPLGQLRRSVLSCLLWEDSFYEDGEEIATRIARLVALCDPFDVSRLAIEAREKMKLRHVPLLMVRELVRHPEISKHVGLVRLTLERVIQRADELTEFMALYWKDGRKPIAAAVKKGLAAALAKFSEYDLAKYNRDGKIKLRDVLFLTHAKPSKGKAKLWKRLVDGKLETPDTWEVAISAASPAEKSATWTRLLAEKKLGALALLRNLRNLSGAGISDDVLRAAIAEAKVDRVLPYRFIAAARFAPQLEDALEAKMLECVASADKLSGHTILLVDVSGSMDQALSSRSDLTRIDAACGLAILAREIAESCEIWTFSQALVQIPPRHGFALRDAIKGSQPHGGTLLGQAISLVREREHDRLIVITDEQSSDVVPEPAKRGYMLNVASYKNGVGRGRWTRITGWSEAVLTYVQTVEGTGQSVSDFPQ